MAQWIVRSPLDSQKAGSIPLQNALFTKNFFFRLSNPLLEDRGGICATYYPLDDGAHPGFFFCLFLFTETK